MEGWTSATWAGAQFRARLERWADDAVGPVAVEPVSLRPWSAVWRVRSGAELHWAKQNCPGRAHEARLLALLADAAPERVVRPLAADDDGLFLSPDAGPTWQQQGMAADVASWCAAVTAAADLQRRAAHDAIAGAGLTPMEPADATTYVADAVGRLAALPAGDPRRLDAAVAGRLQALLPRVEAWSDAVAELDLPLALVHNDLHLANVVGNRDQPRLLDLGDAVAGPPLGLLLVPLLMAGHALDAAPGDPRLRRIADAAIEVWSDRVRARRLRAALPATLQLARLARVESWRRVVRTMGAEERTVWGGSPARWLESLLEPSPLGATPLGART